MIWSLVLLLIMLFVGYQLLIAVRVVYSIGMVNKTRLDEVYTRLEDMDELIAYIKSKRGE